LPDSYFDGLSAEYEGRRSAAISMLEKAGFRCFRPQGAYYVMTDISAFGSWDDVGFARFLVEKIGVAGVPGSSFYLNSADGSSQMRFCFCKKYETLTEAGQKFAALADLSES
jgi:aspartate/methionine/tyrosine aminotransferase